MKRFLDTKLFLMIRDASQTGVDADVQVLQNSYDEFVMLLFAEGAASKNKAAYHNALIYTRVELAGLTGVSEKKCGNLSCRGYPAC